MVTSHQERDTEIAQKFKIYWHVTIPIGKPPVFRFTHFGKRCIFWFFSLKKAQSLRVNNSILN
jgi:hypothetical protein